MSIPEVAKLIFCAVPIATIFLVGMFTGGFLMICIMKVFKKER